MMRMSLRWKILLYASALVAALTVAMLVYVNYQAERFVSERIIADLEQGRQRVRTIDNERRIGLQLTAQLVASFPKLKGLLDTDAATISDFLSSYQQESKRSELLIALDPTGRVVGRTDMPTPAPLPEARTRWVQPLLTGQPAGGVLVTQTGVYWTEAAPASATGIVFGFVIAGARLDSAFAQALRGPSDDGIVVVGEQVLGATLSDARLPWRTRAEWERAIGGAVEGRDLKLGDETYAARRVPLGREEGSGLFAIVLRSRDAMREPYRRIQWGLIVVGLLVVAVGIAGSAVMARTVTSSIGQLVDGTKRVATGVFDTPIEVRSRDEIGDLALAFNVMLRGLRERADMQKFVSRSTIEMIQADSGQVPLRGQRIRLTIFFSDIRGFTEYAEQRPPEAVVRLLNACLSLQAERVKKFHGDVDKFVGDSVVALFSGEEGTLNAIRCAIEIEKAMDAYNAAQPGEEPAHIGIGIVTGEVILGSIGSKERRDFTAIGSNVNLCARLCSMAGPREILLAESAYEAVKDLVAAERLEPLTVKGFSKPVLVYRITVS